MKRIRVCHFAASPGLGRGEFYVDLANAQSARDDLQISILAPHDAKYRERIAPTVEVLEYRGGRSRWNPFFLFEVARTLRAWQPDLVHTHFAKASEVFRVVRRWVGSEWVATKHNPRRGPIFEKAPHVIGVSKSVAESLRRRDVKVIYNGVEFAAPHPGPRKTWQASPSVRRGEGEEVRVLAVGRLEAVKGYDQLIRALVGSEVNWHLQLAGEGTQRSELEKIVRELKVEGRVELLGFRADVPELLRGCDVFVQSSISEGFGVALLEAMHFAPLAISTKVGIAAEIFPEWLLWNLGDAAQLETILKRRAELMARFAGWAPAQLERFSLRAVAEEHARFYREILLK